MTLAFPRPILAAVACLLLVAPASPAGAEPGPALAPLVEDLEAPPQDATTEGSSAGGAGGWTLAWWAAVVAVAVYPVARTLRRWRLARCMAEVELAHHEGRHEFVLDHTPRLLQSRRTAQRAAEIHALSLLDVEGPETADLFLEWMTAIQRPDEATLAFLQACIAQQRSNPLAAGKLLHRCLHADPHFASRIAARPGLATLLADGHHHHVAYT